MSKGYYLVTKPLQYFNVTNIKDHAGHRTCIVINLFYNAEEFHTNIKELGYWDDIVFFGTSYEAYTWLKNKVRAADLLYIDSDYGLKKTFWLSKVKSKNIYVYEEGTGSYRKDLLDVGKANRFFIFFLKVLGFTGYMGGGHFTRGIVLYDVEKHRQLVPEYRKKRLSFRHNFIQHLSVVERHFSYQMDKNADVINKIGGKKVLLYLSSWKYNPNIEHMLFHYPQHIKIIKLHPHIKTESPPSNFDLMLSNDLFIEIFIKMANGICSEVVVVHENSSAMQYICLDNIRSVNLP